MLVRQFAQPLACLRELVQNSIDAGTNQVEVTLAQEREGIRLSVSDTGEGMTENIIETQLTRLFASSKEGDLTKVGKFGIGFVSVFALVPLAVVVDTGRQGEAWRVLFKPDRSFELLKLPHGVEGTTVHLYLDGERFDLPDLRAKVHQTLAFWCRHCRVEIFVDGQSIRSPFELTDSVQAHYEEAGTRLVLALSRQAECFYGYYNQGLTLLEGMQSPLPHLTFKIDSRYFEHTLTRDNIIQNEDYAKGMALLERVLKTHYPPKLYEHLRNGGEDWELLSILGLKGVSCDQEPLFPDHQGQRYSLAQLRKAQVCHQDEPDELSRLIHEPAQSRLVLRLSQAAAAWLSQRDLPVPATRQRWRFSRPDDSLDPLLVSCQQLGKALGVRRLKAVSWISPAPGSFLWPASKVGLVGHSDHGDLLLLDVNHPTAANLKRLQDWNRPLAAQILLQHLILQLPEKDREARAEKLAITMLRHLK
ncbi:MAG: ATP-binding protein [Candidatus Eremiobacteraeota bacterium]|nr:ATP-binding protein [Candidatus Eremiobacteraeota bacterium]